MASFIWTGPLGHGRFAQKNKTLFFRNFLNVRPIVV